LSLNLEDGIFVAIFSFSVCGCWQAQSSQNKFPVSPVPPADHTNHIQKTTTIHDIWKESDIEHFPKLKWCMSGFVEDPIAKMSGCWWEKPCICPVGKPASYHFSKNQGGRNSKIRGVEIYAFSSPWRACTLHCVSEMSKKHTVFAS